MSIEEISRINEDAGLNSFNLPLTEALKFWKLIDGYMPKEREVADEFTQEAKAWLMDTYEEFINKSMVRMYQTHSDEFRVKNSIEGR